MRDMANTTRAILIEAHTLIQNQQYDEARALLEPIANNPTAAQWLEKIDEILPPTAKSRPRPKPSTASEVSPASRPARPQTQAPTPSPSSWDSRTPETFHIQAKSVRSQETKQNRQTAALIAGMLGVTALIVGVVLFLNGFSLSQIFRSMHTHTNNRMTLQHSTAWFEQDTTRTRWCVYSGNDCLYHLWHPSGAEFFIQVVPLSRPVSADEFAAYNWNQEQDDQKYYEDFLELLDLTVGSHQAMMQAYGSQEMYVASHAEEWVADPEREAQLWGGRIIDIYIVDGTTGYVFTFASSAGDCELTKLLPEFSEIMSSVRFISETIAPAEDGYTPATPVTLTLNMLWCDEDD